jgi:protein-S-isoprenylcysteine O-methyltransferase Ste14
MILSASQSRAQHAPQHQGSRAPLVANLASAALFFLALLLLRGSPESATALPLALCGFLTTLTGGAIVIRARAVLGSAWSLVPCAEQSTGLVTHGPYRLVRHPIYLGFMLIATGQALAFASWPALVIVGVGLVPSFIWRARKEERLLGTVFGEHYASYQRQTKLFIPFIV